MSQVQWCEDCGRSVGIGCNCGQSFSERIKSTQVDRHSLKISEEKRKDPKNRGLDWDRSK